MATALWNGTVLAESEHTLIVEGNHYFPHESVNWDYFTASDKQSVCPWKGTASYYTLVVNGEKNVDAAWYYPDPMEAAKNIEGYVAFWKGVQVDG